MTISENTATFFNKSVLQYDPAQEIDNSSEVVYRLALEYDDERQMAELVESFLARVDKNRLEALIIGMWGEPYDSGVDDVLDKLVEHASSLPNLRALFFGDMTYEECEISWITQGAYNGLLEAYPNLEVLRIRGSTSLSLAPFTHHGLRQLVIEAGGLPEEISAALAASNLPNLTHLELWLGTEDYGFSGDVALYQRLVANLATPTLRYLGLRDSEIADDLALWLGGEPLVAQLETLDLSLGTIGDRGAEALFNSPHVAKLSRLNLSHHYISEAWQARLRSLPFKVELDDPQEEDDGDRYVAVGE